MPTWQNEPFTLKKILYPASFRRSVDTSACGPRPAPTKRLSFGSRTSRQQPWSEEGARKTPFDNARRCYTTVERRDSQSWRPTVPAPDFHHRTTDEVQVKRKPSNSAPAGISVTGSPDRSTSSRPCRIRSRSVAPTFLRRPPDVSSTCVASHRSPRFCVILLITSQGHRRARAKRKY